MGSVLVLSGQDNKKPMHIPLRLGLFSDTGAEIALSAVSGVRAEGDVLHLEKRTHRAVFENVASQCPEKALHVITN